MTFEDWISFSCYVIWIMDDVKCAIFVALMMAVAADYWGKWYMCLVKGLIISLSKKCAVASELKNVQIR